MIFLLASLCAAAVAPDGPAPRYPVPPAAPRVGVDSLEDMLEQMERTRKHHQAILRQRYDEMLEMHERVVRMEKETVKYLESSTDPIMRAYIPKMRQNLAESEADLAEYKKRLRRP